MDSISTLGLRIDANGVLSGARQTNTALDSIGVSTTRVEGKLKTFSTNAAFAFSSLASSGARDITSVLRSLSSLGFAFGAVTGAVTLLGSSILDGLVSAFKEAKDESKRMADALIADARRLSEFSQQALEVRLAALERQKKLIDSAINAQGRVVGGTLDLDAMFNLTKAASGRTVGADELARYEKINQQIRETVAALRDAREAAAKFNAEAAKRTAAEFASDLEATLDAALALDAALQDGLVRTLKLWTDQIGQAQDEAKMWTEILGRPAAPTTAPDGFLSPEFLDSVARNIDKVIDRLKQMTEEERRAAAVKIGGFAGILSAAGVPGGGVLGGAISGFATGGVLGGAFGAAQGLVGEIIGMSNASAQAREQLRRLNATLDDFTDTQKEALGVISGLDARIRQVTRDFADAREAVKTLAFEELRRTGHVEDAVDRMNELNDLEARRINQMRDEQAVLEELERTEKFDTAMRRIQDRIASFADTISGLEVFRNSLLLSDARSPAERLAEAQRQYDEIMGIARGDDIDAAQLAAGRLPGAAQALLDAARTMFSSGSGFQDIFSGTLADTQELIDRFTDLKTIEELMLDELQQIRAATAATATVITNGAFGPTGSQGGGGSGGGGGTTEITPTTANVVSAVAGGAHSTIAAINALAERIEDSERRTRSSLEAVLARL